MHSELAVWVLVAFTPRACQVTHTAFLHSLRNTPFRAPAVRPANP